jgi:putative NADH-flavin reductase
VENFNASGQIKTESISQPILLRTIYEDKDHQEIILKQSELDWIGVRPGMLTNGTATGKYRVLLIVDGVTVGKIARADVAGFVLDQLSSEQYLHQFPVLTY